MCNLEIINCMVNEYMPWEKPNKSDPPPGENEVLEDFLTQVFQYLFNKKKARGNLWTT